MTLGSSIRTAAALACAITSVVFAQGAHNNHLLRLSQEHGFTFSEISDPGKSNLRIFDGSESRATTGLNFDDVALLGADTSGALYGIRLATVVPSPGGAAVLALGALLAARRRR